MPWAREWLERSDEGHRTIGADVLFSARSPFALRVLARAIVLTSRECEPWGVCGFPLWSRDPSSSCPCEAHTQGNGASVLGPRPAEQGPYSKPGAAPRRNSQGNMAQGHRSNPPLSRRLIGGGGVGEKTALTLRLPFPSPLPT